MKGFSLDLHCAVRDAQDIFEKLGHTLDVWSISDHHWVNGWERAKVDVVNEKTWWNLNQEMCDHFYDRYKNEFKKYDFFYTFYSPTFAKLYERWEKPIIMHVPLRFETPFFNDPGRWLWFNDYAKKKIDEGQIIPLTTNKYDQQYLKLYLERDFKVIPNLCEYTGADYTGKNKEFLYCSKMNNGFENNIKVDNLINRYNLGKHSWQDICDFEALIYIPYSNTLSSLFEQYTSNIPLLFPTHEYFVELFKVFGKQLNMEISFRQVFNLSSGSIIEYRNKDVPDPNDYVAWGNFRYWTKLFDCYDQEWFPHIQFFDSISELEYFLKTLDFQKISDTMKVANVSRKQRIYNLWEQVLKKIN